MKSEDLIAFRKRTLRDAPIRLEWEADNSLIIHGTKGPSLIVRADGEGKLYVLEMVKLKKKADAPSVREMVRKYAEDDGVVYDEGALSNMT